MNPWRWGRRVLRPGWSKCGERQTTAAAVCCGASRLAHDPQSGRRPAVRRATAEVWWCCPAANGGQGECCGDWRRRRFSPASTSPPLGSKDEIFTCLRSPLKEGWRLMYSISSDPFEEVERICHRARCSMRPGRRRIAQHDLPSPSRLTALARRRHHDREDTGMHRPSFLAWV